MLKAYSLLSSDQACGQIQHCELKSRPEDLKQQGIKCIKISAAPKYFLKISFSPKMGEKTCGIFGNLRLTFEAISVGKELLRHVSESG